MTTGVTPDRETADLPARRSEAITRIGASPSSGTFDSNDRSRNQIKTELFAGRYASSPGQEIGRSIASENVKGVVTGKVRVGKPVSLAASSRASS